MEKGSYKTAGMGIEKFCRISEFIESLKEEFADEIISKTELVFVPNIQKEMTKNRIIDLLTEFSNRLINSLPSHEHNYQIARENYYKPTEEVGVFGAAYKQDITYLMLYCTKCGEIKEITSRS